jgi:hypothetical protein
MKAVKVIRAIILSPVLIVASVSLLIVAFVTLSMTPFDSMENLWWPK